jgi:antitoxin (DNA-binding transcriptional repressor) of toxin-antitoxin stability system
MATSMAAEEVDARLPGLLDRVERGEEVAFTRGGRTVAKLVPVRGGHDVEAGRAAVAGLRELAREMNLGRFDWDEWKGYRDAGWR